MRLNFIVRIGLILLILGAAMMLNFQMSYMPISVIRAGTIDSGETQSYSLFVGPVGLGNVNVGYNVLPGSTRSFPSDLPIQIPNEVVLPVRLVIINPLNVTVVDMEVVTPCLVPVDFDKRGEYVIHVTSLSDDEQSLFPIGLNFPNSADSGNVATGKDVDKFFVGMVLLVSGAVFFCLGLLVTLFSKLQQKRSNRDIVKNS
jgi:hypothetical protein